MTGVQTCALPISRPILIHVLTGVQAKAASNVPGNTKIFAQSLLAEAECGDKIAALLSFGKQALRKDFCMAGRVGGGFGLHAGQDVDQDRAGFGQNAGGCAALHQLSRAMT